jgi:hypothetical protein
MQSLLSSESRPLQVARLPTAANSDLRMFNLKFKLEPLNLNSVSVLYRVTTHPSTADVLLCNHFSSHKHYPVANELRHVPLRLGKYKFKLLEMLGPAAENVQSVPIVTVTRTTAMRQSSPAGRVPWPSGLQSAPNRPSSYFARILLYWSEQ